MNKKYENEDKNYVWRCDDTLNRYQQEAPSDIPYNDDEPYEDQIEPSSPPPRNPLTQSLTGLTEDSYLIILDMIMRVQKTMNMMIMEIV